MKMLIELWLDGYQTEKEHKEACIKWVEENLDSAGTNVKVLWVEKVEGEGE